MKIKKEKGGQITGHLFFVLIFHFYFFTYLSTMVAV